MGNTATVSATEPLPDRLRRATAPAMVEAAPGKWAPAIPQLPPPDVTLARYVQNPDGTYRLVPFQERMLRLDSRLARLLGFPGGWNTLRRLGTAGFVEMIVVSPGCTLINLDSWFNHLRRCAENPEMWERNGKWFKAYQEAL